MVKHACSGVLVYRTPAGFACHTELVLDFRVGIGQDAIRARPDILGLDPQSDPDMLVAAAEAAIASDLVAREDAVFLDDLLDVPRPKELRAVYDAMDDNPRNTAKRRTMARLVERRVAHSLASGGRGLHWQSASTLTHLASLAATAASCPAVLVMTTRLNRARWIRSGGRKLGRAHVTIDLGR